MKSRVLFTVSIEFNSPLYINKYEVITAGTQVHFFALFALGLLFTHFAVLAAILFLADILYLEFVQNVHTNFHAKSGVCGSKNGQVIALGTKEESEDSSIIYLYIYN